jgi:hypothetical protein
VRGGGAAWLDSCAPSNPNATVVLALFHVIAPPPRRGGAPIGMWDAVAESGGSVRAAAVRRGVSSTPMDAAVTAVNAAIAAAEGAVGAAREERRAKDGELQPAERPTRRSAFGSRGLHSEA